MSHSFDESYNNKIFTDIIYSKLKALVYNYHFLKENSRKLKRKNKCYINKN